MILVALFGAIARCSLLRPAFLRVDVSGGDYKYFLLYEGWRRIARFLQQVARSSAEIQFN